MVPKGNKVVRKLIYFVLFAIILAGIIYLGEKYKNNSSIKESTIEDFYSDVDPKLFEVVSGSKLITMLKSKDNYLIMVGSSASVYSQRYIKEIETIAKNLEIEKVYYYDSYNDKSQKNSNYYEIRNLLHGYLTTTDGSSQNLLAPSFYIIRKGEVKYYNTDTSAMKNTDNVEKYWSEDKQQSFAFEITDAINKYYLKN